MCKDIYGPAAWLDHARSCVNLPSGRFTQIDVVSTALVTGRREFGMAERLVSDHFGAFRFLPVDFAGCAALFSFALAVRTAAAASDAFLARTDRSSAVRFLAEALPPCRPNLR